MTAAVLVLGLGAVALTDAVGAEPPKPAETKAEAKAPSTTPAPPPGGFAPAAVADYRIGPKDLVQVTVFNLEGPGLQTIKSVRVSEAGGVTLPMIKESVKIAGLTELETQRVVAEAYRKAGLLDQADVSVGVLEARNLKSITAGERVTVSVLDLAGPGVETTKTSRVDEGGNISVPMIGEIKAKGLRGVELEKAIRDAYHKAGLVDQAVVAVSLPDRGESHRLSAKTADRGPVSISGPVARPGGYELTGPMTLRGLIAAAGGFTQPDEQVVVELVRAGEERGTPVNGRDLLRDDKANPSLAGGDSVIVRSTEPEPPASRPSAKLERRTYNVDDLLGGNAQNEKAELVETILENVAPASWRKNGGEGSATIFGANLIVTAPDDVHREVTALLAMLRKQAAALPDGATPAEEMTVEQIAEFDPQMANHLQIRSDVQLKLDQTAAGGAGPNTQQIRVLTDMLAVRDRLITERAEWFRNKHKGRYLAPADKKLRQRGV